MKKLKVLIFGSSGMVGKGVLLECIDSVDVESVLLVNRSPIDIKHSKIKEIIHKDFTDFSSIENEFRGLDACYFTVGVSSAGLNEKKYSRITYDLTIAAAKSLINGNKNMTFIYVSGSGTDTSEKGRIMWARVKGRTENAILNLGFKYTFMYRPGYIQPMRGIKSKTALYNSLYVVFAPLYPLLNKIIPKHLTTTEKIGKSMINVSLRPYPKRHLSNNDINITASINY
ncbi:MAG: epimerase [Chlorobi bacterium]|nr:epimerase [Chlorobiota bacterium]